MNYLKKSILLIFVLLTITACSESKSVEIKKSNYDIKQCNKESYTKEDLEDYKKLVEQGEIQGYNCIGIYYMRAKDYKNAKKYFYKGKEKGSLESYAQIGSLYRHFLNDNKKAVEYFTIAANNGHGKAAHNLGVYYDKNFAYKKALKWYEKSFNKGDTYSLLAMAHVYRKQKNYEEAIKTFKKAG
ncbi:tetratricopeptide repeat protein, partial [Arcobacter sp. YIC-80]|uniref:tetratricopeptide repeat protein n=1 Tax=Arcobacter sp. YIC-80 TaxID=3376683 RepID=UPI00384E8D13